MSLTNPNTVVTEQRLSEFYQGILPYLGGMPEMVANKFSKGDLYSTEEKMIGQWVDGKPLYQRTIVVTGITDFDTSTTKYVNLLEASNLNLVYSDGQLSFTQSDRSFTHSINNTFYNDSHSSMTFATNVYKDSQNNYIRLRIAQTVSSNLSVDVQVTVRYTKINDTAISIGNDTDYSTEEKIVGTWIDGKPVYQRVIITTSQISLTANTWFTSSISIPNIETIVGGCIIDTGGNKGNIWIGHDANTLLLLSSRTNNWVANAKIIVQYTKTE